MAPSDMLYARAWVCLSYHNVKLCVTICLIYVTQHYHLHRVVYIHTWKDRLVYNDALTHDDNAVNVLSCY